MIDPIALSFEVDCEPERAFHLWTTRATVWWPVDHTMSQMPGFEVCWEGKVGGRIFERLPDGTELEWGEVVLWDPPRRLSYLWHIARERSLGTDVEMTFTDLGGSRTRIDVLHSGWERLGEEGPPWRERNAAGWSGAIPLFQTACAADA